MKKSTKIRWTFITIEVVFLIVFLLACNHLAFGVWNPFSVPKRIYLDGRNYKISNFSPMTFSESENPEYSLNEWVWTGKLLYSREPKGTIVPTVIYLKLADGKYQLYSLLGSN
ncbi:MAG: hypothetical protein FD133_1899 [Erysipelotrichaceae bacterium]|nr:MAG: hypothetical protein FD133_1899 [Erysipelotrichaceae bacterium]